MTTRDTRGENKARIEYTASVFAALVQGVRRKNSVPIYFQKDQEESSGQFSGKLLETTPTAAADWTIPNAGISKSGLICLQLVLCCYRIETMFELQR